MVAELVPQMSCRCSAHGSNGRPAGGTSPKPTWTQTSKTPPRARQAPCPPMAGLPKPSQRACWTSTNPPTAPPSLQAACPHPSPRQVTRSPRMPQRMARPQMTHPMMRITSGTATQAICLNSLGVDLGAPPKHRCADRAGDGLAPPPAALPHRRMRRGRRIGDPAGPQSGDQGSW